MIQVDIPGYKRLHLAHAVFDVNGTLAREGRLLYGVDILLAELRKHLQVHMLTADTHGRQAQIDKLLGFQAHIIRQGADEKRAYVQHLRADTVVAIGNGANDALMCQAAELSIGVIGPEGMSAELVQVADVLVTDIHDAIDLLLHPDRLRATLRR